MIERPIMKSYKLCYFSATAMELPSLSEGVRQFRSAGGHIQVYARIQTRLFNDDRCRAFVREALSSDVLIISLHGGKASCPAFDLLLEALAGVRTKDRRPYLHIQPVGSDEDSMMAAGDHSPDFGAPHWNTIRRYLAFGGHVNFHQLLIYLHNRMREDGYHLERTYADGIGQYQNLGKVTYLGGAWQLPRAPSCRCYWMLIKNGTGNLERAGKLLSEMVVGGRTPLSAGLSKSFEVTRNYLLKEPTARPIVILITDGKSNVALGDRKPIEECRALAAAMAREERIKYVVVDTEEDGIVTFGLAKQLAAALGGDYFKIDTLKAEELVNIVKGEK